jgi:hypothetical protein
MRLGVEGKAAGWRTLRALADTDTRLDRTRLDDLITAAQRQSYLLEELRIQAAADLIAAEQATRKSWAAPASAGPGQADCARLCSLRRQANWAARSPTARKTTPTAALAYASSSGMLKAAGASWLPRQTRHAMG